MPRKGKKRKIIINLKMLAVIGLAITSLSSIFYVYNSKENNESGKILSSETRKMVLPTQYSDSHVSTSAMESNIKYRNIAIFDKETLLANASSSLRKDTKPKIEDGPENGTWLWTPILQITPEYRDTVISGAVKNGIKNIYISIDSYLDIYIMPDGKEKSDKKMAFDRTIEDFIVEANKKGITIDAEAGWRNWAEDGHTYKAFATLNYAIKFNKFHTSKFRGFQYDVEPYLLDKYSEDKKTTLTNFLNLINQSVSALNNSDLELSVVIPEFYDGTNNDTPKFVYKGTNGFATDHLLTVLDRRENSKIIVMSYRNFSQGADGSIDISKNEIQSANSHRTKVILAQESGDVEPPYITFYKTSKRYYKRETGKLVSAFKDSKGFDGLAVHYINAFMELR